jgi:hypothetical protein
MGEKSPAIAGLFRIALAEAWRWPEPLAKPTLNALFPEASAETGGWYRD